MANGSLYPRVASSKTKKQNRDRTTRWIIDRLSSLVHPSPSTKKTRERAGMSIIIDTLLHFYEEKHRARVGSGVRVISLLASRERDINPSPGHEETAPGFMQMLLLRVTLWCNRKSKRFCSFSYTAAGWVQSWLLIAFRRIMFITSTGLGEPWGGRCRDFGLPNPEDVSCTNSDPHQQ